LKTSARDSTHCFFAALSTVISPCASWKFRLSGRRAGFAGKAMLPRSVSPQSRDTLPNGGTGQNSKQREDFAFPQSKIILVSRQCRQKQPAQPQSRWQSTGKNRVQPKRTAPHADGLRQHTDPRTDAIDPPPAFPTTPANAILKLGFFSGSPIRKFDGIETPSPFSHATAM
jgi:hypothetical protein